VGTDFLARYTSERPSAAGPSSVAEFHLRVPSPRDLDDVVRCAPYGVLEVSVNVLPGWTSLLAAGDVI